MTIGTADSMDLFTVNGAGPNRSFPADAQKDARR